MDLAFFIINLSLLLLAMATLLYLQLKGFSFNFLSLTSLVFGLVLGGGISYLENKYLSSKSLVFYSLECIRVISEIYLHLLKSMLYPVIIVAILSSVTKVDNLNNFKKYGLLIVLFLMLGVIVASVLSIIVMYLLNLPHNIAELTFTANNLANNIDKPNNLANMLISFAPINPFLDLTGARSTSTIATVVFMLFIGIAFLIIKPHYQQEALLFTKFVNMLYLIFMQVINIILKLTPYGILAIISLLIIQTNITTIFYLLKFFLCLYFIIIVMLLVQFVVLSINKFNPLTYYKKVFPLLNFAFLSRSSASSIPIGINIQTKKLGINHTIANLSTTIGSTMGQTACGGIYITMVTFLTAAIYHVDIWNIYFILSVIGVTIISTLGMGGIASGAIYGALIALSIFNYPITFLAVLIPIDAILDMGRTMLNVNGITLSALLTSKFTKSNDIKTYNS
ncbi:cation:dicarboxylate symporter family transporter [Rickettsiales bacterium LUAb2]